jgi:hypothetical protein
MREWKGVSLDGLDNVAVHGRNPIDADAKADYFDSLYYSSAVVGLCTTVFLEAAIIGRPVLTLQLPAYRLHQDGMLHFRYLLTVEGGLLHTAPDIRRTSAARGSGQGDVIARRAQPAIHHGIRQARRGSTCRRRRGSSTRSSSSRAAAGVPRTNA